MREQGPQATLDDVPDAVLDRVAALGFDYVWLLGIWQTGPAGRQVSRSIRELWAGFRQVLPDVTEADVVGSPFAVRAYTPNSDYGGAAALARIRQRLQARGQRLILDFVPNHVALDHPWIRSHPEYFIHGTAADLARQPHNYLTLDTDRGPVIFAHGRDPYFPGWMDTLQLNYRHPGLRAAMRDTLLDVASLCDGVRCDMAMLLLPDVIQRTWGTASLPADGTAPEDTPFWPEAIAAVKQRHPEFLFLAEVYWDLEWTLLQQGFDYAYDKRLYDRLRDQNAPGVRTHLGAGIDYQRCCARFLENHDEPRAAAAFPPAVHRAAAVVTYFTPGLRFSHEGQLQGRRVHTSIHLARRAAEPVAVDLQAFYVRLLGCLRRPELRSGQWQLLPCRPAWDGNPTSDHFLAFAWDGGGRPRLLAAVNYGPTQGQCYVGLPGAGLRGRQFRLADLLGPVRYDRGGDDLAARGLYLDLPAWGYHLFDVTER